MNLARGIFLVLLLMPAGAVRAQMGGTVEECDRNYGPRIETHKATLPQCDPGAAVYSRSGVTLIIEFQKGRAAHMLLHRPLLQAKDAEDLLTKYAGGKWSTPLAYEDRQFRLSEDKSVLAIILNDVRKKQILQVELLTRGCAGAGFAKQMAKLQNPGAQ